MIRSIKGFVGALPDGSRVSAKRFIPQFCFQFMNLPNEKVVLRSEASTPSTQVVSSGWLGQVFQGSA